MISISTIADSYSPYRLESPRMTRRSQKLQEARERRYRQESTYNREESINTRKALKPIDKKGLAKLYRSLSNLFGKKLAEKVKLDEYSKQISFLPNETFFKYEKGFKEFKEYFVRVTPKTHLIYEIVAKSSGYVFQFEQIEFLKKAVEDRYGVLMTKLRDNEYVLKGKDGIRSRVLKIVGHGEYLELSLLDVEGQKQAFKEREEIEKLIATGKAEKERKRIEIEKQKYDELSTLFGVRLGDKINGEQKQVLIPIYPKRKFLQYNDYYIKITPKSHLVYEIMAKAEVDISSALEDFELTRKAVESKYGFYMNEKKNYSSSKEYSLEGVDEKKRRLLKIIKDYEKVELSLVDIDLSNLADIENKKIENDIKARKEQSRNSIAESAADAL